MPHRKGPSAFPGCQLEEVNVRDHERFDRDAQVTEFHHGARKYNAAVEMGRSNLCLGSRVTDLIFELIAPMGQSNLDVREFGFVVPVFVRSDVVEQ